ncbi:MAG: iron-containing alcohol dehydrogenase [Ruminococcus sp.]|nr:iron-containing alcohol dehydrogenase [Ruminococcus sp.]
MKFYMPTRFYCERNCVSAHSAELSALGSNALIVTGRRSSKLNGSLDDVLSALSAHGVPGTVFDEAEENPSVETVMRAAAIGREAGADLVIGVGGGSALDAAKAVALMLANPGKTGDFLYESVPARHLPVAAVPTTCGTGSEVTGVSVLTRHDLKTKVSAKHLIFPDLALADGKYLFSASRSIIVNTAVDALSHLIESVVNLRSDRLSEMNAFEGLRLWAECREYIEGAELDAEGAEKLMAASSLAGVSIAQTGTTLPHALSYMLTYRAGVPHGPAVGAFEANYLRLADKALSGAVLSAAGFKDCDELDAFIRRLAPIKVSRELLELSAESVLAKPEKLALCPFEVGKAEMERLIKISDI